MPDTVEFDDEPWWEDDEVLEYDDWEDDDRTYPPSWDGPWDDDPWYDPWDFDVLL
jgi:hypothetical protein